MNGRHEITVQTRSESTERTITKFFGPKGTAEENVEDTVLYDYWLDQGKNKRIPLDIDASQNLFLTRVKHSLELPV